MIRAARAYPLVAATILVAIVALGMLLTPAREASPWLVGIFALAIAAFEAVKMVRSLLSGNFGLDILAVTAITAAVLVGEPWAALVVVLMLTGGEALEHYAENRSKRELIALLDRAPQYATLVVPESPDQQRVVPVDEVNVGDVLLVRPGAVVPVDAVLLEQSASFDESSLTGESLPVERAVGEIVASGAVNGTAAVHLRAKSLSADSQYQQIVALVEKAQASKSPTVRLADRYAVPFTLFALALAGAAWAVSGDASRFAEVLVVATPCPLLIAAPVAFLGGMSRAAKHGLIVKSGGTLEQLARVRSAAFDKTGTLTSGKPSLTRVVVAEGFTKPEVLRIAASAEAYSSHVLAAAIVQTARKAGLEMLPVREANEFATNGVEVELAHQLAPSSYASGQTVRVGKPSWVAESAASLQRVELEAGELAVYVAIDGVFAGALVMRDHLRPEAPETISQLRDLGVSRMLIVTGDVSATAHAIATDVGIDDVRAECTPADKVEIAASVTPRPLLMTGDGLNDAPVLAAADVGFAMGARGATAASESADVVNRFDSIAGVVHAVRIGRDTVRIALQSIWLGILLSVALMLVAAFGFLPALVGAWLQEVVDLVAILGALRAVGPRAERRSSAAVNAMR